MVACYDVWLHHATKILYAVTIPHLVSPMVVRLRVILSAPLKKKVRWRRKRVLETLEICGTTTYYTTSMAYTYIIGQMS